MALIGAARGPGDLAKEVMVPEAADRGRVSMERAMAVSATTERLAATVGPAVGGVLVSLLGPITLLLVNVACMAAGSLLVALALPRTLGRPATRTAGTAGTAGPQGYWRSLRQGLTFVRRDALLLTVVLTAAVTNLLDAAFMSVLLPVWARESGHGPALLGLVMAVFSGAAVVGGVLAAVLAHRLDRRLVVLGGFALLGAPVRLVLLGDLPVPLVLAVFVVAGVGGGFINPVLGAVMVERVPREMLGRVNALADSVAFAGIPFGGLLAGAAVGLAGAAPALLVSAVLYSLATTLAGLRPQWREMDRPGGRPRAPAERLSPEQAG
jgi:MFS family permease